MACDLFAIVYWWGALGRSATLPLPSSRCERGLRLALAQMIAVCKATREIFTLAHLQRETQLYMSFHQNRLSLQSVSSPPLMLLIEGYSKWLAQKLREAQNKDRGLQLVPDRPKISSIHVCRPRAQISNLRPWTVL